MTGEVSAIQRDGTTLRDVQIADWMGRSDPYGEYRAAGGEFSVITPSGDMRAGVEDWIVKCAGMFVPCPVGLFEVLTGESTVRPVCSECCDSVPRADLFLVASGAELCPDCLLEYQLLLEPDPSS
jgi:hypothetical protein